VEDNIESHEEFWTLLRLLDGDRDRALGMLVRFWRIAQNYWGHGELVPPEEIEAQRLQPVVESKWAIERDGRYYAIGSEEQFAWYRGKVESGKARAKAERGPDGQFVQRTAGVIQRRTKVIQREEQVNQPPAPAPSPAPIQKQEYIYSGAAEKTAEPISAGAIKTACEEWVRTLNHFGAKCAELTQAEQLAVARGVHRFGHSTAILALRGFRNQQKTETYDPAKHLKLSNVFDPQKIDRLINLGRQAEQKEAARASPARARAELPCHFCGRPNDQCVCGEEGEAA
jgi:hypothetical protein